MVFDRIEENDRRTVVRHVDERHYEACAVDMAPASDAFSLKDIE